MHGDADTVVPYEHATRYVEKAKQAGDPATLVPLPGIDHPNISPVRVGEDLWNEVRSHLDHLLSG
jgi:dipeptidyl aminopeptidase/acylaminoacyl peptidase